MATFLDKLLQLIPEAFYDLIGRILPGGIVLVAVGWSLPKPVPGITININAGGLELFLFVVLAYAVGLAVSTLAHVIHRLSWFVIFPFLRAAQVPERLVADLKKATGHKDIVLNWNPFNASAVLDLAHDCIKQRSAIERPVVTKLLAEVALLHGVAIAAAIGCLAKGDCGPYWWISGAFLVAGLIRSLRAWHRHQSILSALANAPTRAA
jgi:hypothetical protein